MKAAHPIGIFDSGVGGLSVLRHLRVTLAQENLIYIADQAHVPYGSRSRSEILHYSKEITRFLLKQNAKLIVVACNTATAAALHDLRQIFSEVPFVGMEPAVKPAALRTRTGKVGVLATENTFASDRYGKLMSRFAGDVQVYEDPCQGLVPLIEAGLLDQADTEKLLQNVLDPMIANGVDTLVLGCTHYPFVRPLLESVISRIAGAGRVKIIDPAPAVARQAKNVLLRNGLLSTAGDPGSVILLTSGDPSLLGTFSYQLLGQKFEVGELFWQDGKLCSA